MIKIDVEVHSKLTRTARVMQLEGMFDVPPRDELKHEWHGEIPIDERDWNIGLIVGPSGSGKSTIGRQLFGAQAQEQWSAASVIDDFDRTIPIDQVTAACSAVGFNTIPSWMKPFNVLSTGEQFRVSIARALLERQGIIVIDEFTSVVDRQVAKIGSNAVQKFVRRQKRKFVAISCHYDIVEWLQPDWILEPATMTFQWRSVQRRPSLDVEIARVDHAAWRLFAPFHYLTAELHKAATCFVLFVDGVPAAFAGVLHRPHPKVRDIKGLTRGVTLPDYQGMGLFFVLIDALGSAYKTIGNRLHLYPAHPSFIRSADRSSKWALKKKPGVYSPAAGATSSLSQGGEYKIGGRPCAVFEYCGEAMSDKNAARKLLGA